MIKQDESRMRAGSESDGAVEVKKCSNPPDLKHPDQRICHRCEIPYDGDYCTRRNADRDENFQNARKKIFKAYTKAVELQDGKFDSCIKPEDGMRYNSKLQKKMLINQVDVYVKDADFEHHCKAIVKDENRNWIPCTHSGNRQTSMARIISYECNHTGRSDLIGIRCKGDQAFLNNLQLCELRVPLSCEERWWGLETGCNNRCSCLDDVPCDDRTGECPAGKELPTPLPTILTVQPSTTPDPTRPEVTSAEPTTQPAASTTPEPMQPLTTPEPMQLSTTPEPMQPSTTPEPMQPSTTPEPMQPSTTPEPMQPSKTPEPLQPLTTPEPMQPWGTSGESTMWLSTLSTPEPSTSASTSSSAAGARPSSTWPEPAQTSWTPASPSSSPSTTALSASMLLPSSTAPESTRLFATSMAPVSSSSSDGLPIKQGRKPPRREGADPKGSDGETDEDWSPALLPALMFLLVASLFAAMVAAFVYRRYKKRRRGSEILVAGGPDLENNVAGVGMEMAVEPFAVTTDSIPVDAFRDHICRMVKADGFAIEYKALPTGILKEVTAATDVNNGTVRKNRFKDISPYDETRVILPKEEGKDCDYINASYINGFNQTMTYIAAQGPLAETAEDFWHMIWADSCGKIVMLTNLCEQAKIKCEQYWPQDEKSSLTLGQFTVTFVSAVEKGHFTHRVLAVTKTANQEGENEMTRQVHQFHFTAWPDHGVPCPVALVQFWYQVVHQPSQLTGPMLVHCSAGIGRTGTFIALDMLIQQAEMTGKVSVYPTVTLLRNQRVNMVQTLSQYRFLHEVVKEWLASRDTTVVKADLTDSSNWTGPGAREKITAQFEVLDQLRPSPADEEVATAKMEENLPKNRFSEILPVNQYRVCLATSDDSDNDYINAVFISSLASKQRYMVTQLPLEATVQDFFQMVLDWEVTTIVRFMDTPEDQGLMVYPQEGEEVKHGRISVRTLTKSVVQPGISLCTMHLHSAAEAGEEAKNKADEEGDVEEEDLDVNVYCVESAGILKLKDPGEAVALTNILGSITKTEQPPVLLQCFTGAGLSCILCSVVMVREAMQVEGRASPFLSARLIQSARPQAFKTLEEYEFVVRCLLHGAKGTPDSEASAYATQNSSDRPPADETTDIVQNDSKYPPANGTADNAQNDGKILPPNGAADVPQNE